MPKLRVYQLARELNRDNSEIIRELQHMGVPVTSHSNTVDDRHADELRRTLGVFTPEAAEAPETAEVTVPAEVVVEPAPVVEAKPEPVAPPAPPPPPEQAPVPVVVEVRPEPVVERPAATVPPAPPARPIVTPPAAPVRPAGPPPVTRPAAPITPAAPPRPPAIQTRPSILSPIVQPKPAEAQKKETSIEEQRKTIQQIVQERLRNRFPQPTAPRRPLAPGHRHPTSSTPARPGVPGAPREGSVVRPPARAPVTPARPGQPEQPRRPGPEQPRHDRAPRYEREAEKRLESPFARAAAKVEQPREFRKITLTEGLTVKDLAEKLDVKTKDLIRKLMDRGVFATINQALDKDMARQIASDFNAEAEFLTFEESVILDAVESSSPENLKPRPPVVTVMGHVDHGKTSLLDAIRKARVTEQEHGGITQHIGAYQVEVNRRKITFLDTPGHEAFTLMRARGAKVTDVVILVVAADDGIMPQTVESISHTRAAKVPIIVAINKVDKPDANVERVKRQLAEQGLLAEDWGGDTVMVEVSAKMGTNIPLLLEMILLVTEIQNLKADPDLNALGTVLEAKVDRGRGNVATVLIQNGTLHVGDNFLAGSIYGKVRAMFNEHAEAVKEAGPSTPVEVLGLQGLPAAGDTLQVIDDENKARQMAQFRQEKLRDIQMAKSARLTLDQLHRQLAQGDVKEVQIILKCDVHGSMEALSEMLNKLSTDKVKVRIIHSSVGAITEGDVLLATASNAIIVGFNVRPERKAGELANREKIDIRLHTIIYNVVDEIKRAMVGVLEPVIRESYLGTAEVRNTFRIPKVGMIAGCYITDGRIVRNAEVRLLRDNTVIYEGKIASLRRFKEDAAEVARGYECGIGIQNFNDIKVGDVIEAFVVEKIMADANVG